MVRRPGSNLRGKRTGASRCRRAVPRFTSFARTIHYRVRSPTPSETPAADRKHHKELRHRSSPPQTPTFSHRARKPFAEIAGPDSGVISVACPFLSLRRNPSSLLALPFLSSSPSRYPRVGVTDDLPSFFSYSTALSERMQRFPCLFTG